MRKQCSLYQDRRLSTLYRQAESIFYARFQVAFLFVRKLIRMLKIYGLSEEEIATLKQIAQEKNATQNLSHFGREVFRQIIAEYQGKTQPEKIITVSQKEMDTAHKGNRVRVVIRLTETEKAIFERAAKLHEMSVNMFLSQLLRHHIDKVPTMTRLECDAVFKSQYNLTRIGRFLNEIVKNMKAAGVATVSIAQMERFQLELKEHTNKVGEILAKSQERF